MPLSPIDGLPATHWNEVFALISASVASIKDLSFTVKMVSDSDDVGVIHHRIVSNLYQNDIVVCDVSAKNPNVMFELGMRLAFDKPVVIIKDNATDYAFDTGVIEHIPYPRDLRFSQMVDFQAKLAHKVEQTYRNAKQGGPDYKSFLSHFGTFAPATVESKLATRDDVLGLQIEELRSDIRVITRRLMGSEPIEFTSGRQMKKAGGGSSTYIAAPDSIVTAAYQSLTRTGREVTFEAMVDAVMAIHPLPDDMVHAAIKSWASRTGVAIGGL